MVASCHRGPQTVSLVPGSNRARSNSRDVISFLATILVRKPFRKVDIMQRTLSPSQTAAFYHKAFVDDQVDHFMRLTVDIIKPNTVAIDIGGGCGYFAQRIADVAGAKTRVIDLDPVSIKAASENGIDAILGDALNPPQMGDEGIVCFNLVLHHLVGETEMTTRRLQGHALRVWASTDSHIFVNEYIYESWFGGISGWLIYQITKSTMLSAISRVVARVIPSLRANTFGVGVRFRSNLEWQQLFREAGFEIAGAIKGTPEPVSWARRLLLIKNIRRESFLLSPGEEPRAGSH